MNQVGDVLASDAPAAGPSNKGILEGVSSLVLPGLLLGVVVFWMYAPDAWIKNSWIVTSVGVGIKVFALILEQFFERHASWRMDRREWATDIFYFALGHFVISELVERMVEDPLKGVKTQVGFSTEWISQLPFLPQVLIIMLLGGFTSYWMHRWMHNNAFLWSTHAPHHHITQLNALKGAVGNPLELFLIGIGVVFLFDFDKAALFCAGGIMGATSTFAHANIRFTPPRWFGWFFTTIRHHSLHHSVAYEDTRWNYGDSIIIYDRLFGTFREGEASIVGQGDRRRLTIKEQFLFPAYPLIERWKAARQAASARRAGVAS